MDRRQANRRGSTLFICAIVSWAVLAGCVSALGQIAVNEDLLPNDADRLRAQIERGSDEEKRTALSEIRNRRSETASRIALPALRDKDPVVRATAVASVVFLPRTEAASSLVPLLSDKSEFVRRETAYALGDVGDSSAVTSLVRLMQTDIDFEVRTASAASLGKIGDPSAADSLLTILRSKPTEDNEFLRRSAARSIGQIAQLRRTGKTSVLTPQNFLPEKYKELGPAASVNDPARLPVFKTAVDVLLVVLRNKNESDDTRREAAFALGAIGDGKAIPTLQTFVSSDDPYMAEISREALLKIGAASDAVKNDN